MIKQDESSIDAAPTSNIIFHAVHLSGVDFDIEAAINNAYLINCTCIDIERGAAEIYFKTLDTPATQAIEEFSKKCGNFSLIVVVWNVYGLLCVE